jgi:hypothetical protein
MWAPQGKLPIVIVTGSHKKTCVFGPLTIDGKQLFRQYKTFDQYSFISYLQELKRKFHKFILFLDRAPPQHCRSQRVKAYVIIECLPKGSADLSAVEECWSILPSVYKPKNSCYKLLQNVAT